MKATVTSPESCLKVLEVEIPQEEIASKFDIKVIKAKKDVKLPGFRPGKVPTKTIIARFGDSIKAEVIDEAMNEAYRAACMENKINPVGEPVIEDVKVEEGKPVTFKASIQVDAEISLKDYKKLGIKISTDKVADKDLDEAIANILEQFAEMKDVKRKAKKGDVLTVKYTDVKVDGEVRDAFNPAPQMIEIGKAPLKELETALKGLSKDEEATVSLTFPKDFAIEDVAGQSCDFSVIVENVQEKNIPEVNYEFLKKINIESEEKFRKTILEDLKKQKEQANKSVAYDEAIDKILKKNDFDVPEQRVDAYLAHIMKDEERYYPNGGQPSFDNYKEKYTETALKSLKRFRILEFVAKAEKLKATSAEVDAKIQEIANQYQQPFETVKQAFRQNGTTVQIREDVKEQKALDCLVGAEDWPSADTKEAAPKKAAAKKAPKKADKEEK